MGGFCGKPIRLLQVAASKETLGAISSDISSRGKPKKRIFPVVVFAVVFGYFSRRRHHEAIGQKGAKTFHHRGFPGDSSA